MTVRLADIHRALGGELVGAADVEIERIGTLADADSGTVCFLAHPRYRAQLALTAAACVIVAPDLRDEAAQRGAVIVTPDPYVYFARLTQWWAARSRPPEPTGVHASAVISGQAQLGRDVSIGPLAVVEAGARIEAGVRIGAHCVIGRDTSIGSSTVLSPHVTLARGSRIGQRCIVHAGAVLGADGFGFARAEDGWVKIEQLGAVRIGDDVEIGANTCIDRGALTDTIIEDGVKLDNLIQIGHNVQIGAHSAMAGCAGVAGSAKIGRRCTIGGGAIVLGHLELTDDVHISAASVVTRSILQAGHYSGVFPLDDNAAWEKNAATLKQLHALRERLRALEKKSA